MLLMAMTVVTVSLVTLTTIFWLLSDDVSERVADQERVATAMITLKDARYHVVQIQQFLTDVAATADDGGYEEAADNLRQADASLDRLARLVPGLAAFATDAKHNIAALNDTGVRMARAYVEQGRDAGNVIMKAPDDGLDVLSERLSEQFEVTVQSLQRDLDAKSAGLSDSLHTTRAWITGLSIATLLIAALVLWLLDRRIVIPIRAMRADMEYIAARSDLTKRLPADNNDGVSETAKAFNMMLGKFRDILEQVSLSSTQLAAAAEEMSLITEQTSSGVRNQQNEIDQVATAMNEMSATVQEVARNAEQAAHAAHQADRAAKDGVTVANAAQREIAALVNEVEKSAGVIQALQSESENIGMVLDVIKGIAEQTNLLALNAAIEAARAGEQGRGFAVVADEVRTLASRTQKSTQEIHEMIDRLQSGASNAVKAMTQARNQGQSGVGEVQKVSAMLGTIANAVTNINDMNTQIASAAEEQSAVAEEINRNVANISEVSEQSSHGADQIATASGELSRLASGMQGLVSQFKV
jgi:methyl-accepting chemotaxis protein